ncbi:glycosyltransferase family 4 protein [Komarekiella sp. 'clone 1']|uniref:Glycosyltransferase family 4 protein n=1 Tax=Komarekiella delphini-convector SJRDD-AB1 TaxID=2593771 RepID=A0AA40VP34_9NOST|nr:glycosyltransferase family 4 protein [Komarekiella delphini-convector]MBD6614879.1 glycosyltransferase family 4 protein [Komarekiella delphini-convector SJRDD-AB1]
MRIIHILNHVQKIGNGIVNVAVDLACLQAKTGNEVAVVSVGGEYEALLAVCGVKHYHLDQQRNPINIIKAAVRYQAIAAEFQPDIVHAHMMTGIVLARFLRYGHKYALVSTVHNEFQRTSLLMGLADRVIAVSKAVQASMARRGIPENKLRVVCNGTLGSPRTRNLHDYQPLPLQHPAIATVAGMYKRKGIAELIAAFEQIALNFPQAHLYLVGNGPDRELFEAQALATSVGERIHFEGFQPEPQRYLKSCDIFVLASHRDPCPLVLSEAREAGAAIIGTQVDGIPEALDYGQAGLLVPTKDSKALAKALVQLLSNADTLYEWKNRANQNLEWLNASRVHQETLGVYCELITQ